MTVTVVSANLGCGGPGRTPPTTQVAAWLESMAEAGVDVLLLQEMPRTADWTAALQDTGYALHHGSGPTFRCQSGVVVRRKRRSSPAQVQHAGYHGTYLAAADVELGSSGTVTCVSVHASPTPLTRADLALWPGRQPQPRHGTPGDPAVWHSDHILETLSEMASDRSLLAAGDLNEARRWDDVHGGHWGADFFSFAEGRGLIDLTYSLWNEERPTRPPYQVDHALATRALSDRLTSADVGPATWSDHRPLMLEFSS